MKNILANLDFSNKHKYLEKQIRICLVCGSKNTCVNQYGIFCKSCGSLWDFE